MSTTQAPRSGLGSQGIELNDFLTNPLNVWGEPKQDATIEGGRTHFIQPTTPLADVPTVIEFNVHAGADYIHLEKTRLHGQLELQKFDTAKSIWERVPANDTTTVISCVNALPLAMIKQTSVELNGTEIDDCSNYGGGYKAILEQTFSNSKESVKNFKEKEFMFFPDSPGKASVNTLSASDENNTQFDKRRDHLLHRPHFIAPIACDLFTSPKYLVPGISMRIRFSIADPNFYLIYGAANTEKYRVVYKKLELAVRYVVVNPSIKLDQENKLKQGHEAIYDYPFGKISTHVVPTGLTSSVINEVCKGELPSTMLVGFVSSSAYNSEKTKNPFNFLTTNINEIYFDVLGNAIPARPFKPDFDTTANADFGGALREFHALKDTLMLDENYVIPISYEEFVGNMCLFSIDINGHLTGAMRQALSKTGTMNVHVSFATATTEALHMIVYSVYHRKIYIAAPDGPKLVSVNQSNYLDKRK